MDCSRKILVLGVITLFMGLSVVPLVESMESITEPPVSIDLDGILGENGWFVSSVTITFIVNGEEIDYIMFELNGGGWTVYIEPLVVGEDGEHTICWYYVDYEGNHSEIEYIDFKIDQTDPTIYFTTEKIYPNTWLLMADVTDETSGIAKVEFYVNGEFVGEVTEAPYEWIYTHRFSVRGLILNPEFTEETVSFFAVMAIYSIFDYPVAQAIVYDNAGNTRITGNTRISNPCPPINNNRFGIFLFQRLTFQNNYSGYIGEHFIFAVFEYGPWLS